MKVNPSWNICFLYLNVSNKVKTNQGTKSVNIACRLFRHHMLVELLEFMLYVWSNLVENSHKHCWGFQQAMEARTTCFISFIKLFSLLTKKMIYEVCTVNSHNSETVKPQLLTSFLRFIALWKHTCRPVKTHVLSKLCYRNI